MSSFQSAGRRVLMIAIVLACLAPLFKLSPNRSNADDTKVVNDSSNKANQESQLNTEKMLRHIVLFQFKPTSTPAQVQQVVDAFGELPRKIDAIAGFEWGTNNSPEGLNDGLTHAFIVSFRSDNDRDTYLKHPEHQAFVDLLKPHLQKPLVVDFWVGK